ncbi:acetoacetate decarboxylase family protein [Microvirga massiliensis]|uniref:acetoacetate decarboxylase family protein n=1 Tax=Microvirga massiliensis TaxID=1033741 RepID=UPI00065FB5B0|nr:acetoacetate decarboxylase family protein [Microvirga massiliensis]
MLAYNALLPAVRVRLNRRRRFTITHIWLDRLSSIAGARALWGIPKQFAKFKVEGKGLGRGAAFEAHAEVGAQPIAFDQSRPRLALPGWWRFQAHTAHSLAGSVKITRARARARLKIGSTAWLLA